MATKLARALRSFVAFWTSTGSFLVFLLAIVTGIAAIARGFGLNPRWFLAEPLVLASWAGALLMLAAGLFAVDKSRTFQGAIQRHVDELVRQAEAAEAVSEYVEKQLSLASAKERRLMASADSRSRLMFALGSLMVFLSVTAPLASIAAYVSLSPIPEGISQADVSASLEHLTLSRDWRVLIFGLSVGFLFLAASKAFLAQEERQRAIYFQTEQRVRYFEDLAAAVRLTERIEGEFGEETKAVAKRCIDYLMVPPGSAERAIPPGFAEESGSPVVDAVGKGMQVLRGKDS